jgi:hypothetical protein
MKELSIYLETAIVNQPLEHVLNQSITAYPRKLETLL